MQGGGFLLFSPARTGNLGKGDLVSIAMPRFTILLLTGTLLLAACVPDGRGSPVPSSAAPVSTAAAPMPGHLPHVDWLAYHDDLAGFSIQVPLTWRRQNPTGYPVVYALAAPPGTGLLEKRLEINVTPNAKACRESTYNRATETTPPANVLINGIPFVKETGSGIAAGNIYDWIAYSTLKGTNCITVTFVLHSASSGVYSTEPAPFDKAVETAIFEQMMATFKFDP